MVRGAAALLIASLRLTPVAVAAGFISFLITVDRFGQVPLAPADAVVVFTGEPRRIEIGFRLLADGYAHRMLISGTELSAGTDTAETMEHARQEHGALLQCCVDLDPRAQSTVENARDAAAWLRQHSGRSVILVTADYHMPRSLLELSRAAADVRIIPHPLVTAPSSGVDLDRNAGWLRRACFEYGKWIAVGLRPVLRLISTLPRA